MKEARRSYTGELRWFKKKDSQDYRLQQKVLIEGTKDGIWVHKHEWKNVDVVVE